MLLKESYGYGLSYCESCLLHRVSYYKGLRRMRPATKRSESQANHKEKYMNVQFKPGAIFQLLTGSRCS